MHRFSLSVKQSKVNHSFDQLPIDNYTSQVAYASLTWEAMNVAAHRPLREPSG
jgi:hypothetical protein